MNTINAIKVDKIIKPTLVILTALPLSAAAAHRRAGRRRDAFIMVPYEQTWLLKEQWCLDASSVNIHCSLKVH